MVNTNAINSNTRVVILNYPQISDNYAMSNVPFNNNLNKNDIKKLPLSYDKIDKIDKISMIMNVNRNNDSIHYYTSVEEDDDPQLQYTEINGSDLKHML